MPWGHDHDQGWSSTNVALSHSLSKGKAKYGVNIMVYIIEVAKTFCQPTFLSTNHVMQDCGKGGTPSGNHLSNQQATHIVTHHRSGSGNSIVYRNHKVCDGLASLYDGVPSYIVLLK